MKVRFYSELIYELCSTEDHDKTRGGVGGRLRGSSSIGSSFDLYQGAKKRNTEG